MSMYNEKQYTFEFEFDYILIFFNLDLCKMGMNVSLFQVKHGPWIIGRDHNQNAIQKQFYTMFLIIWCDFE